MVGRSAPSGAVELVPVTEEDARQESFGVVVPVALVPDGWPNS